MMTTTLECRQCGGEYSPRQSLKELCPRCLFTAALPDDASATLGDSRKFVPPKLTQLQSCFPALEILELIGHGGMSAVYKARQVELDRVVALKIMPPEIATAHGAERFLREAKTLAKLSHPGIVAIHEYGKAGPWCYLLVEFIDGSNLRQLLGGDPLAPSDTLHVIRSICDALEYAHGEGVVHRDIKPENILLTAKGEVKLVDFGLAKLIGPNEPALTAPQQVLGTYRYMAPEQLNSSEQADCRSDLYSLGIVIYELLTGEVPVGRFRPASQRVAVDIRFDNIVHKAIERERMQRYQSVSELRIDIDAIAEGKATAKPDSASGLTSSRQPPRVSRVLVDVLRSVLFIAYVLCLYHFFQFETDHVRDVYYKHRVGQPDPWLTMWYRHEALAMGDRLEPAGLDVDIRFDTGSWLLLAVGLQHCTSTASFAPGIRLTTGVAGSRSGISRFG